VGNGKKLRTEESTVGLGKSFSSTAITREERNSKNYLINDALVKRRPRKEERKSAILDRNEGGDAKKRVLHLTPFPTTPASTSSVHFDQPKKKYDPKGRRDPRKRKEDQGRRGGLLPNKKREKSPSSASLHEHREGRTVKLPTKKGDRREDEHPSMFRNKRGGSSRTSSGTRTTGPNWGTKKGLRRKRLGTA